MQPYYDERWKNENVSNKPPNAHRVELVAKAAAEAAKKSPRVDILDVGCGNGWILARLSELTGERATLHGIEPSAEGVKNTQQKVPRANVRQCSLANLESGASFDIITCSEVIEHVMDQQGFLADLANRLRKTGVLILTTPNGRYASHYFDYHHIEPQPVEKWIEKSQILNWSGALFEVVALTTFDISEYYYSHPIFRRLRARFLADRNAGNVLEQYLLDRYLVGLYWFVVMRRRETKG
jgi:2-polyprenyl-3-methyl-5-hydroxy-6-metoxy-1,4-benzoquinol methylase